MAALERARYQEAIAADKTKATDQHKAALAAARRITADIFKGQGLLFTPQEMAGEVHAMLVKLDMYVFKT